MCTACPRGENVQLFSFCSELLGLLLEKWDWTGNYYSWNEGEPGKARDGGGRGGATVELEVGWWRERGD